MARWDQKFKERLKMANIKSELDGRYVDDGRLVLYPIRSGWRWHKGGLWFREDWEQEDQFLTAIERTKRVISSAMQGLTECLSFTVETQDDFEDGWLPTLDIKLRVMDGNQIAYTFYSKPTASKKCLQAGTALNHNCIVQSLSNEVMRRLANISIHLGIDERVRVMDDFSQMMVNSGHEMSVVRKVVVNGMKCHTRKEERCNLEGKPFHRSAADSAKSRKKKKLTAKQNWFKFKERDEEEDPLTPNTERGGIQGRRSSKNERKNEMVTSGGMPERGGARTKQQPSTVIFVEYTKGASLQKAVREVVDRLCGLVGFNMTVAERGEPH